jgi:hypothetical protein
MELLGALIGAIIGAGCSFLLSEYAKRKDERKKLTVALLTEVRMNLDIAEEIMWRSFTSLLRSTSTG